MRGGSGFGVAGLQGGHSAAFPERTLLAVPPRLSAGGRISCGGEGVGVGVVHLVAVPGGGGGGASAVLAGWEGQGG